MFCCSTVFAALRAKQREKPTNGLVPCCRASCAGLSSLRSFLISIINRLKAYSLDALNVVSEKVDDFHVERARLQKEI